VADRRHATTTFLKKRFKFKSNNGLMMTRNSPDLVELLKTEGQLKPLTQIRMHSLGKKASRLLLGRSHRQSALAAVRGPTFHKIEEARVRPADRANTLAPHRCYCLKTRRPRLDRAR
jgi:hypothetical protein